MQGTRSQRDAEVPKTYILDFFRDEQDGCALTVRINDARFHIVVDPARLKSDNDNSVLREYKNRLNAIKKSSEQEDADGSSDHSTDTSADRDSGVDLAADQSESAAETQLQNWLLSCFANETARLAPAPKGKDLKSLEAWYDTPIHYFEVVARNSSLQPEPLDESAEFRKRINDLFPSLPLPKSLRELGIPVFAPSDLTVITTLDEPPPTHPSILQSRTNGKRYFFKPVDPTQPQPTKREIKHHHEIQSRGLDKIFKVPELLGLVTSADSTTKIMGILLTVIEDPVPLTKLLDSEVDESKRKRWAKESDRIVKVLHENNIVWGDAKADNFMVDKNDGLWIIDFGGSYTEGWVHPEDMETIKGDDEATEKIVNALKDPDGATVDMEEEARRRRGQQFADDRQGGGKRKRAEQDEDEDTENEPPMKAARNQDSSDAVTEPQKSEEA